MDNHIIITPTSSTNFKSHEMIIPRFGSRKDIAKSLPKSENSEEQDRANQITDILMGAVTWDNRSFKKQPKQREHNVSCKGLISKQLNNDISSKVEETTVEEVQDQQKSDSALAKTFLNECETLEEVITNLMREIDEDKKQSDMHKQEK